MSYSAGSDGGSTEDSWINLMVPYFLRTLLFGSFLVAGYYFFNLVMNTAQQDPSKFEIKMAKDIETRLDDVKGIDEIKDEIKNVI